MSLGPHRRLPLPAGLSPAALLFVALLANACADGGVVTSEPAPEQPAEPFVDPALLASRFLSDSTALVGRDTLALHRETLSFYRSRQFGAAWSRRADRDSLLAALRTVEDEGIRPADVRADLLAALTEAGVADDSARVDRDILLTEGFLRLADALLGRRLDVEQVYVRDWYLAPRDSATAVMLGAALADSAGRGVSRTLDALRPADPEYRRLRSAMARALRDDGSGAIDPASVLSPGDTSEVTLALRRRLARTGDWAGRQRPDAIGRVYDEVLADALRGFQVRVGLEPSGELDDATLAALNMPGRQLAPLLAVNLERWRWLPRSLGDRHVWVNIPAYELELRRRAGREWQTDRSMPVVVGSAGRWQTPVFSDTISQVVFNPTWTIPASIQMESYGRVDPRGMVRGPGPSNPLGRVKFVFPNPHGIYLHDTNARRRLAWEYRALSHGCIRLGDPEGLAGDVLAGDGWDSTRVAATFAGPWETQPVDLSDPLPVHLVYFTARAVGDGAVRRVGDVYGWDRPLARALGYSDEEFTAAREAVAMAGP